MVEIATRRLQLRPVTPADTGAIAERVFGDADVVAMLAHDVRGPEDAWREAARWTGLMGLGGSAGIWEQGGIGLCALVPHDGDGSAVGVLGCYMERGTDGRWGGEYFYALGRQWHGQGLMSEAADALSARLRALPDLGVIYAVYWDMINEASGRILRRSGLTDSGRKPVLDEYPPERCAAIHGFDLWRLARAEGAAREAAVVQAARRAGAFVAEGAVPQIAALAGLGEAYGGAMPPAALHIFAAAAESPGMAYLELRGEGAAGAPVNRLG